jgi:hypothetical protein
VAFPFAFVAMWYIVTAVLGNLAGMSKGLSRDLGVPIRSSGWGSANVNGAGFGGCLKVREYRHGFILQTHWLFGNREAWIPKDNVRVSAMKGPGQGRPYRVDASCGGYEIEFDGKLADFIQTCLNDSRDHRLGNRH